MPDPPRSIVLDASVLFPIVLCDTLLRCADAELYRPRWSVDILEELFRNLQLRIGVERARRRIADMGSAFPYAAATDYRHLIGDMTNHPKDRHVLAVAVAVGAPVIVTVNVRDFPRRALERHQIEAQHPDLFLLDLIEATPAVVRAIIERQAADYHHPPMAVDELLRRLAIHAPEFVRRIESDAS